MNETPAAPDKPVSYLSRFAFRRPAKSRKITWGDEQARNRRVSKRRAKKGYQ